MNLKMAGDSLISNYDLMVSYLGRTVIINNEYVGCLMAAACSKYDVYAVIDLGGPRNIGSWCGHLKVQIGCYKQMEYIGPKDMDFNWFSNPTIALVELKQ